jgi:hypothetical protein
VSGKLDSSAISPALPWVKPVSAVTQLLPQACSLPYMGSLSLPWAPQVAGSWQCLPQKSWQMPLDCPGDPTLLETVGTVGQAAQALLWSLNREASGSSPSLGKALKAGSAYSHHSSPPHPSLNILTT